MITGFFVFIHVVTAILLILVILMQSGRGGGLTETFASAESMFGAKTNEFLVRATVILAAVFLGTSLILAYVSSKKDRSLIPQTGQTIPKGLTFPEAPAQSSSPAVEVPTNGM